MPQNPADSSDPSADDRLPEPPAPAGSSSQANGDGAEDGPLESRDGTLTVWQKRMLWRAVTGLAIALLVTLLAIGVWVGKTVLGFLQPVLVPLAVAGVIAFLLDPLIANLHKRGWSRKAATATVLGGFLGFGLILLGTLIPLAVIQGQNFIENWPKTVSSARSYFNQNLLPVARMVGVELEETPLDEVPNPPEPRPATPEPGAGPVLADPSGAIITPEGTVVDVETKGDPAAAEVEKEAQEANTAREQILHQNTPFDHFVAKLASEENRERFLNWSKNSLQGVLGIVGYLLGFLLVPVYLFFFLKERTWIKRNWRDMIPLRNGRFKNELGDVLQEINGYLIAFFRGQVVVSMIDGVLTAILLWAVGLPYGLAIGFALAIIGIIPFVGIIVTMIPAVIVAFATASQHHWDWVQAQPGAYALLIVGIFFAVQQFDGLVIQPKIVGDATGLHPMTIILSVVFWSFLLGGVLGAILAVPLSAAIKVLLRRYVWDRPVDEAPAEDPNPPPRKRGAAVVGA